MHKDELLQLHSLLCQVKRFMQDAGLPLNGEFHEYEDLEVSPQHIHKSKTDHKKAVFMLGKGLSEVVLLDNREHLVRLRDRFLRLAAGENEPPAPVAPPVQEPTPRDTHLPAFALAALSS